MSSTLSSCADPFSHAIKDFSKEQIQNFRLVCKGAADCASHDNLWQKLCNLHYPGVAKVGSWHKTYQHQASGYFPMMRRDIAKINAYIDLKLRSINHLTNPKFINPRNITNRKLAFLKFHALNIGLGIGTSILSSYLLYINRPILSTLTTISGCGLIVTFYDDPENGLTIVRKITAAAITVLPAAYTMAKKTGSWMLSDAKSFVSSKVVKWLS